MREWWHPVVGYEGAYEVSSRGRVRGLPRLDARGRSIRGRVLRPTGRPYLSVSLCQGGRPRTVQVHRLVLEAFVGLCPPGMEALHIDDVPTNNAASNLRWGTHAENVHDTVRSGRHSEVRKTRCPQGHLLGGANARSSSDRSCKACRNGRSWARDHRVPFTREIGDRYYAALVGQE
ncbi:hypothetical protein QE418_000628 [Microbacterium testaceum]|uniref:NUMOD4 motif-containing HNH endonuclease n=1 Tax=Microbacterium TaxID=33882 RepID=UPI002789C605|nr:MULTISPECIES: NUMOD4 motif-containing HNH endonuclease [Microbacterium]MDQ1111180.1 hypothetical protein [Microbacterium testaceum]MDR6098280.1 hypothetical protein [Microbacterium sp. SORGH_AS_0454]